ncbi:helix-turn-helix domain-containing protein [Limosilactobacillus reuteri]|uniref:helix-turn-helix domain-containing protein n=2 Tax=Limosilactobacillus reuteri TaxID=1598 RepID=UPI00236045ED|nr:helix-turn-helix transcriptional regulator [Limosilactobacillus reuteri]MDD1379696.1 helix-turn-helix transcriptional regulator [Limosilactobacillus reuteri]
MNEIGVNISRRRHNLNMTQEELANATDLSTNYVSRLERGEVEYIRAVTLYKIAKGLKTTMEKLIDSNANQQHTRGYYQSTLINLLDQIDEEKAEEISKSVLDLVNSNIVVHNSSTKNNQQKIE